MLGQSAGHGACLHFSFYFSVLILTVTSCTAHTKVFSYALRHLLCFGAPSKNVRVISFFIQTHRNRPPSQDPDFHVFSTMEILKDETSRQLSLGICIEI